MRQTQCIIILLSVLMIGLASCVEDDENWIVPNQSVPSCIRFKITTDTSDYVLLVEYDWNTELHYLFIRSCCHHIDELYDANCNYICGPTGAIHGNGDYTCPEFSAEACCARVLWKR